MSAVDGERAKYFPAIEKKHGEPIASWISRLTELGDVKYPEQIAYLRENFGFSQTHANALVMYVRGSTTSKRFASPQSYFATLDPKARAKVKEIFAAITSSIPDLEIVMAWNQPILRNSAGYLVGLSVAKNHITINPFGSTALDAVGKKLTDYKVNKKTFVVPLDWKVDAALLRAMVKARLKELR